MTATRFDPGAATAYVADHTLVLAGTTTVSETLAALVAAGAPVDELLGTVGETVADVGVVGIGEDTTTVLLRGAATARLAAPTPVVLRAGDTDARSEHPLDRLRSIELTIGEPATSTPPSHRSLGGIVPAARLVRALSGDAPDPYDAIFGHTVVRSVEGAAVRTEPAARPPIAVLVFSTGERVLVDRLVLLGRNPSRPATASTAPGAPTPVVTEPHRAVKLHGAGVSRRHAAIHVEHWRALIDDLGSANGTEVTLPGRAPQRLTPGSPVGLVAGARVALGGEVSFVVEEVA